MASVDLSRLDGTNGFQLNGAGVNDRAGSAAASAGDMNGDGLDDVIINAYNAYTNGLANAGIRYVVFGSTGGFDSSVRVSALDGSDGFNINGISALNYSGRSVSGGGDFNGDGLADIILGSGLTGLAGETYVIFGNSSGFSSNLDLSTPNGSKGFRLTGLDSSDYAGRSVSNAGDVNGVGLDDFIIGAPGGDQTGSNGVSEAYVGLARRGPSAPVSTLRA